MEKPRSRVVDLTHVTDGVTWKQGYGEDVNALEEDGGGESSSHVVSERSFHPSSV